MKQKYHGWIYIEKREGFTDHFTATHWDDDLGDYRTSDCGYGAKGAAMAVSYFESDGGVVGEPIKLLPTPLGLRVYTEEEEVGDVYETELQISAVSKTLVNYLTEMVDAMARLSEVWADSSIEDNNKLNDHYPSGWPDFEGLVGDAIEWLNKVKGKP